MLAFYTNLEPMASFEADAGRWCNDELLFRHYRTKHHGQLNAEWADQVPNDYLQSLQPLPLQPHHSIIAVP